MNIIGFIFARGGSKAIPNKNLVKIAGKTLLEHAIHTAFCTKKINRVILSTDDESIAENGRKAGAEVPFLRPKELARDDSPEWLAWQPARRTLGSLEPEFRIDVFLSVPTTAPLRYPGDLDACINRLIATKADAVVTITETSRHPAFNMVKRIDSGGFELVQQTEEIIPGRQYAPYPVYDMTTVAYALRPEFILNHSGLFDGKVEGVVIPRERALDIDTPSDLLVAKWMYMQQHREIT